MRKSPGAALSIKMYTYPMKVTHTVLLFPISESRLRNTLKALWLHPVMPNAIHLHPPPQCVCHIWWAWVTKTIPNRSCAFSQLAGVGQGTHVLSAVVLSKSCGWSNMYRAQTLKRKAVCRAGKRREEDVRESYLSFFPITFLLCSELLLAGRVYKTIFSLSQQAHGWQF